VRGLLALTMARGWNFTILILVGTPRKAMGTRCLKTHRRSTFHPNLHSAPSGFQVGNQPAAQLRGGTTTYPLHPLYLER
jgi:hypothetical protein